MQARAALQTAVLVSSILSSALDKIRHREQTLDGYSPQHLTLYLTSNLELGINSLIAFNISLSKGNFLRSLSTTAIYPAIKRGYGSWITLIFDGNEISCGLLSNRNLLKTFVVRSRRKFVVNLCYISSHAH